VDEYFINQSKSSHTHFNTTNISNHSLGSRISILPINKLFEVRIRGIFARTNIGDHEHFCLKSFSVFLQDTFDAAEKSFDWFECHKNQILKCQNQFAISIAESNKGDLFFTNPTAK